jgi:hypothetical protein
VSALSPAERKKITATEIASWRRIAKIVGVTATVIDAGLIAFGVGFSVVNRNRPNEAVNNYTDLLTRVFSDGNGDVSLENPLARLAIIPYDIRGPGLITMSDQRIHRFGRLLTNIPGFAAGGALVAGGPAHWFTHLAASGAETIGKMKAKSQK